MFKEMKSPDGWHREKKTKHNKKTHLIMWVGTVVQCPNVAGRQNDP